MISTFAADEFGKDQHIQCCVIGSGPAGAIAACRLVEAGWDVVVLEAGEQNRSTQIDTIKNIEIDGRLGHRYRRAFALGGSSRIWGGLTGEMDRYDFERIDRFSGWPIRAIELDKYYVMARSLLGISQQQHEAAGTNAFFEGSRLLVSKSFVPLDNPFDVSTYIQQFLHRTHRGRLRVATSAVVTELHVDDAGALSGLTVFDRSARSIKIKASVVIAALGGIETPRLLLNSRSTQTAGIGNAYDLVGRFLSTHPRGEIGTLTLDGRVDMHEFRRSVRRHSGAVGLDKDELSSTYGLNHYASISPKGLARSLADIGASALVRHNADYVGRFGSKRLFKNALRRMEEKTWSSTKYSVDGFFDQHPDPENRAYLDGNAAPDGGQRISIKWRMSDDDRLSMYAFATKLKAGLLQGKIGDLQIDLLKRMSENDFVGLHSHHLGTTRMATSPSFGVVDGNSRVYSTTNLYIAGPSVFTTYGFANPFLTVAALSLRLADHLVKGF